MALTTKIVIIDSGINDYHNFSGINIEKNDNNYIINNNIKDDIGHGTQMYNIILKHRLKDVEFFFVKIYSSNEDDIDESILIFALEYIYKNINCNIINISLAIPLIEDIDMVNRMQQICEKLVMKNIIIVSSFDNAGSLSYPALFESVIGVTSDDKCKFITDYVVIDDKHINLGAKASNEMVMTNTGKMVVSSGNSIACAHACGIIANIYKNGMSIDDIKKELRLKTPFSIKKSNNNFCMFNNIYSNICNKRAVVFPFNKEIHSLVSFSDLLICRLVGVYNIKYSGIVGEYTNSLTIDLSGCSSFRDCYLPKEIRILSYNGSTNKHMIFSLKGQNWKRYLDKYTNITFLTIKEYNDSVSKYIDNNVSAPTEELKRTVKRKASFVIQEKNTSIDEFEFDDGKNSLDDLIIEAKRDFEALDYSCECIEGININDLANLEKNNFKTNIFKLKIDSSNLNGTYIIAITDDKGYLISNAYKIFINKELNNVELTFTLNKNIENGTYYFKVVGEDLTVLCSIEVSISLAFALDDDFNL